MASEVKVNKISPASGTAFTMGDSGDTFTIPSGATITNNGTANGFGDSLEWQTSDIKTSTFTAVAGKGYFVNTTGGAITVNLPAGSAGAQIGLVDYAGTWDTNNCTVAANGSEKIQGDTNNAVFSRDREALQIIYVDSTQGWVITSVADQKGTQASYISASGGTETTSGDYKIHTFTSSGTFTVSSLGNADGGGAGASYIVVAGGASGGVSDYGGGGGGGGGFREGKNSGDPYTASPLNAPAGLTLSVQAYPVTVGGGGASGGPSGARGVSGSSSVFSTITSTGGGGGGGTGCAPLNEGLPGGSGGGGGVDGSGSNPAGSGNTPPVSPPQGNNGGAGAGAGPGPGRNAGGGGGASAAGSAASASSSSGRDGGAGVTSSISGSPIRFSDGSGGSGGGGGGGPYGGSPGGSTAGNSSFGAGGAGGANTGGAGGASGAAGSVSTSGAGGSGKVVIRYKYQN